MRPKQRLETIHEGTTIPLMHDQKKGAILATDTPEKTSLTAGKLSPSYDKSTRRIDIGIDEKEPEGGH